MEEQAKEELKMLEAQYPNQYEYLKDELRSFIFQLQSKHQDSQLLPENNHCSNFLAFIDTQESTSLEKKMRSDHALELELAERVIMEGKIDESSEFEPPFVVKTVVMEGKIDGSSELEPPFGVMKPNSNREKKRKDRVDLALERAQTCLKKIQHLKTSLLYPS